METGNTLKHIFVHCKFCYMTIMCRISPTEEVIILITHHRRKDIAQQATLAAMLGVRNGVSKICTPAR